VTAKLRPGIDRAPSGKYRVRVHVGGGRYRAKSFTLKKDAERWQSDIHRAKQTGRVETVDADLQTLAELSAEHMNAARADLADSTYSTYRTLWRAHVHNHELASMTLRAIAPESVEQWRDDRRRVGQGEASIRKTMALMQAVFERAVRYRRVASNPVKAVKKPSAKRTMRPDAISPAAVEKIRAQLGGADAVLVSVLAYTGMRPGEARGLRWGDIGERSIRVERAVSGSKVKTTKTDTMRTVILLGPLAADLAEWRATCGNPPASAFVFVRSDGAPWNEDDWRNWRKRRFADAAEAAKVEIGRPYDLRHSAASLWLQEGVNAVQVAAWIGNKPSMTTDTYAHVIAEFDPADRKPAAEVIRAARQDISRT